MADKPKKIVLIEPDPSRNKELGNIFQELNYEVVNEKEGGNAAASLEKDTPDLLLASADGSGEGLKLCETVRKHKKLKKLPIVVLSAAPDADSQFAQHQKGEAKADGYVKCPAPPEDVVDYVETLIGLPAAPNGDAPMVQRVEVPVEVRVEVPVPGPGGGSEETEALNRQIEELQEQVRFFEAQLNQISVTGEKESQEMDQVLNDLQEELSQARKEKDKIREEMQLVNEQAAAKDRELKEKEKQIGDAISEKERERSELKAELEALKAQSEERDEKHRRAQNALREYYKPKLENAKKQKVTIAALEDELVKAAKEKKSLKKSVEAAEAKIEKLEASLEKEKKKSKKIKEALAATAELMSE